MTQMAFSTVLRTSGVELGFQISALPGVLYSVHAVHTIIILYSIDSYVIYVIYVVYVMYVIYNNIVAMLHVYAI